MQEVPVYTGYIYGRKSVDRIATQSMSKICIFWRLSLLFEALMKLFQLQWKSFLNKNLPSLMIYVHKNQCQLFHISNGIIWLKNLISLVHLNSFRPKNLFLHLICVSFKNTLFIKKIPFQVSWRSAYHTLCVMCPVLHVRCHMSGVTC